MKEDKQAKHARVVLTCCALILVGLAFFSCSPSAYSQINNPQAPVVAGTGLTKTGNVMSVNYGTTSGTSVQGSKLSLTGGADFVPLLDSLGVLNMNITTSSVGYVMSYYANNTSGAGLILRKSGGTEASPLAITSGTGMGSILARGYNGSSFTSGSPAAIRFFSDENFSTTANGSYIRFDTTPKTTTATVEMVRFNSTGNVLIGTTTDDAANKLQVNGGTKTTSLTIGSVSVLPNLSATSASIGGGALVAGACATTTTTVTGATTSMSINITPATYPGDGFFWRGYVSSTNNVVSTVCASIAGTPTASTYNIRVIQ